MTKIFNTPFENSLRVLIILNKWNEPIGIETIKQTDLLSIYGKYYGVTEENLNGDNSYGTTEVASKHKQIKDALVHLASNGLASVSSSPTGFVYKITDTGKEYCESLKSDYKDEYTENCAKAIEFIHRHGEKEIRKMVLRSALRRGQDE